MNIPEKLRNKLLETLEEKTVITYWNNLKRIYREVFNIEGGRFSYLKLYDYESVEKYLKNAFTPNQASPIISSLYKIISSIDNFDDNIAIMYKDLLNEIFAEAKKTRKMAEPTQKDRDNYMTIENIIKRRTEYKDKVKELLQKNPNNYELKPQELNLLQKYIILCLYTYIPPRRNEFVYTKLVKLPTGLTNNQIKLFIENKAEKDRENLIDITNKKLVLTKYKTAKVYGVAIFDIPNELNEILNLWSLYNTSGDLLINCTNKNRMSTQNLTNIMNEIFEAHVGSSMLRKIYISNKIDEGISPHESFELSKKMGKCSQMNSMRHTA